MLFMNISDKALIVNVCVFLLLFFSIKHFSLFNRTKLFHLMGMLFSMAPMKLRFSHLLLGPEDGAIFLNGWCQISR